MRIFDGFTRGDDQIQPYPVTLRFHLESADDKSDVHVDQVVTERRSAYATYHPNKTDIWRVHWPRVYRVRIENLSPSPKIDFETLFQFERNNRKY